MHELDVLVRPRVVLPRAKLQPLPNLFDRGQRVVKHRFQWSNSPGRSPTCAINSGQTAPCKWSKTGNLSRFKVVKSWSFEWSQRSTPLCSSVPSRLFKTSSILSQARRKASLPTLPWYAIYSPLPNIAYVALVRYIRRKTSRQDLPSSPLLSSPLLSSPIRRKTSPPFLLALLSVRAGPGGSY